jgi:hypothetical protein
MAETYAKRKVMAYVTNFIEGEGWNEHDFVRRFPGFTRSSF